MSVSVGRAKLKEAGKKLRIRWSETQTAWRDEVSRKFEENHLRPLFSGVRMAEAAMERMHAMVSQIRRDCE